ncbi:hypothetical protein ARMGADRAFT_1037781 [Armillaria gallica]|uniref:Peptidase C14 caspase domain-containing protein n=1 Tax=Armillaria gallica TaxID=47427 RepID=A0A2H3D5K7_ARMGA|nr:hypothetical protein ARMGADRAFT_1037781 [Armillaria gallica]
MSVRKNYQSKGLNRINQTNLPQNGDEWPRQNCDDPAWHTMCSFKPMNQNLPSTRLKYTTQIQHLFYYHKTFNCFVASSFTEMKKPTAEIDLVKLMEKIKPMEQTEMTLAKKYSIPVQSGALNSDDVFQKVEMLGDAKSSRILSELCKHCATPAGMHSNRTTQFNTDGSQTCAVVIGVDAYNDSRDSLHGCVSDALNFQDYLVNDLKVPVKQTQLLLSPNAEHTPHTNIVRSTTTDHLCHSIPTRSNIISALVGISKNTEIRWGDNIFFFFAGHGTCYPCAKYFKDTIGGLGTVEALCPMDRGTTIPDISDREINIILKQICRSKASATRCPAQGDHATFALEESLGQDMLQATADIQGTDADSISVRSPKW